MIWWPRRPAAAALTRRRVLAVLAAAITAVGAAGVAVPARASVPADATVVLQALGLTVVANDGYLAAQGPAAAVQIAAGLFAGPGDLAVYSGDDETGTGTIVLAVSPPAGEDYFQLQVHGTDIASVQDGYADPVGIYTDAGTLDAAVPARTQENVPAVDAVAEGSVAGNIVQVPVEVPVNVCGNTINVVGLLNPATGNTCINK